MFIVRESKDHVFNSENYTVQSENMISTAMRSVALIVHWRVPLDGMVPLRTPPHPWQIERYSLFLIVPHGTQARDFQSLLHL